MPVSLLVGDAETFGTITSQQNGIMTSYSDIPNDFKASVFPDYVRIVTGNAIICSQYVERVFNALCLILKTKNLRFTLEDFMSGYSARTRQTLGMIEKEISILITAPKHWGKSNIDSITKGLS